MDCAVLFADVAGSTALYELLGDAAAFALVDRCLHAMSGCTTDFGGRVVKTIGDAVMAVFVDADTAASAAGQMQLRVAALGPAAGTSLGLRIGFHVGPVVERDGDVFGDTVNLASRLCDLASRGQIVTDRDSVAQLTGAHASALRPLFPVTVKGRTQEVELVELLWQADDAVMTTVMIAPPVAHAEGWARLELRLGETVIEVGPERRKVRFGRGDEADLPVRNPNVSRAHATLERRRDRFVLTDHSLNGTYVSMDGRPETRVHREELPLFGHGWIAFGQPRADAAEVVEFRVLPG